MDIKSKVFISYSHDSETHRNRVLELADRLRLDGIDANIDQYEQSPSKGWANWMLDEIEAAEFVLIICTEQYERRFRGKEEIGKSKGVTWEGSIITQSLYDGQGRNLKFIPVLLNANDESFVPIPLRSSNIYKLDRVDGYDLLYRRLTDQHEIPPPVVGTVKKLPVRDRGQNIRNSSPSNPSPSSMQTQPSTLTIRQLVEDALSDDDLSNLCQDEFPKVYNQFTTGQTKDQRIRLLVDYVSRHHEIPKLLGAIQKLNPNAYARYSDSTTTLEGGKVELEIKPFNPSSCSDLPSIDPRYKHLSQQQTIKTNLPSKADILSELKQVSAIGRNWIRTIDNKPIERQEKSQVIESINNGHKTVLIVDSPGSGKTCLLLDLLEYYEESSDHNVLFIRGDEFNDAKEQKQLPDYLVEKCKHLSDFTSMVVIIDSLDVLSVSRQHETLKFFMRLIDRLIAIEKVSVIVSCRTFDLEYDSHLKNRSWQHKVNLEPLDFDTVVSGFLRDWSIDPDRVNDKLRQLLSLPQNLKIYGQLAAKGVISESTSIYQLHEEFIEELIRKNPQMGNSAIETLQSMADYLLEHRTWNLPRRKFNCSDEIYRELSSLGVILKKDNDKLSFSHQTLAECLMVRSNLDKEISFTDFIQVRVQLPFIRPAVRAFLFYLRVNEPAEFRKQVKNALSSDKIAYHIKRLICESIAEIDPTDRDWNLIRHLYNQHSNLFGSFIDRINSYEWLQFLKQHWLPIAKPLRDKEILLRRFFWRLEVWRDRYPEEVIELWIDAFESKWFDYKGLTMVVNQQLGRLQNWSIARIEHLLNLIMQHLPEDGNYYFINNLSRWIEANNSGDDILWQYMTSSISDNDIYSIHISNKLKYTSSGLDDINFLENRLSKSKKLLDLAVNWIENRSKNCFPSYLEEGDIWDIFLSESSYRLKHSSGVIHRADSLTHLLDGIEKAFKEHCQLNDRWWQDNEPRLRSTQAGCLRYFLIQAYKINIQPNLTGIISQLKDKQLFEYRRLGDELGELIAKAYPDLSTSFAIEHQGMIMSLHENLVDRDDDLEKCMNTVKYRFFKRIPIIFRTDETQHFIDSQEKFHEYGEPSPSIWLSGGMISPPFTAQQLLSLSDKNIIELLNFYIDNPSNEHRYQNYIGGISEVRSVLREAASLDPVRFTSKILRSSNPILYTEYISAIVEGMGSHLRFRFGNLSSGNVWNPVEPLPDGINIAQNLLELIERYSLGRIGGDASREALSGCCDILVDDSEYVDRLSLQLFWLYKTYLHEDRHVVSSSDSLIATAINSTSGVVSEAAMRLYNRRLELNLDIPELLVYLIQHASKDRRLYVRVGIVHQLYFTIYKQPEWGWKFFTDIFQEPQPRLWKYVESCLYYNYHDRFDLVSQYLERIFQEGMEEAGDAWGRIWALACLSGHITQDLVFERLQLVADCKSAWEGVAQVFTTNLHIPEHTDTCYTGILKILEVDKDRLPSGILVMISKYFPDEIDIDEKIDRERVDYKILNDLFEKILCAHNLNQLHSFGIPQYLSKSSRVNPLDALQLLELSALKLKGEANSAWILDSEYTIMALKEILAEVEDSQDMELINRAINLQDLFLELNINGMDNFLDKAARS
jgi:Effector-associated domain 7/SEFIR domain